VDGQTVPVDGQTTPTEGAADAAPTTIQLSTKQFKDVHKTIMDRGTVDETTKQVLKSSHPGVIKHCEMVLDLFAGKVTAEQYTAWLDAAYAGDPVS
jgi:hypothetical protein